MSESVIYNAAKNFQSSAIQHRRHLHQNPELAFQEFRTSDYIAEELTKLGLEVHRGFGTTGLVATISTEKAGPRFLLRFDMDALALEEQSGVEFASKTNCVMHACVHDGNMTIGLKIDGILVPINNELEGSYFLVF